MKKALTAFRGKLRSYKGQPVSLALFISVCFAALITMTALLFLIGYILIKGIPHLEPSLFAWV
ncbi:MAG: phosphate ABC transporter, permease protein PstA, partial [Oscillospiraceae bacterium]